MVAITTAVQSKAIDIGPSHPHFPGFVPSSVSSSSVFFSSTLHHHQHQHHQHHPHHHDQHHRSKIIVAADPWSLFSSSLSSTATIPRIDARELSYLDFINLYDARQPIILTNAFQDMDGTRKMDDEEFADKLFARYGHVECEYQIKTVVKKKSRKAGATNTKTLFYRAKLEEIIDGMMEESEHENAWYLLNESLLDDVATADDDDQALKEPLVLPPALFGPEEGDLFDLFPKPLQPKKHCLIIGGEGSRSFLHADPYEWSGVNYLFEGRKLWTFISPSISDHVLKAERMIPEAWDDDDDEDGEGGGQHIGSYNVSAGWRSHYDLYHIPPHILTSSSSSSSASSPVIHLTPPPALRHALEEEEKKKKKNINNLPTTSSSNDDAPAAAMMMTGIQEAGDLILIPPKYWHQVYHLESSLCLAWQYCNRSNLSNVLRHMLAWSMGGRGGKGEEKEAEGVVKEILMQVENEEGGKRRGSKEWAQICINQALEKAMVLRHGEEKGQKIFQRLMTNHKIS